MSEQKYGLMVRKQPILDSENLRAAVAIVRVLSATQRRMLHNQHLVAKSLAMHFLHRVFGVSRVLVLNEAKIGLHTTRKNNTQNRHSFVSKTDIKPQNLKDQQIKSVGGVYI